MYTSSISDVCYKLEKYPQVNLDAIQRIVSSFSLDYPYCLMLGEQPDDQPDETNYNIRINEVPSTI